MVCSGERHLSPYQALPEVHSLRLADLLLPVVLWLCFVASRRFDQLQ